MQLKLEHFITPVLIGLIAFILIKLFMNYRKSMTEAFGFSDGTLIQLATSHVPTEEDEDELLAQRAQIRHDLIDLTGAP
jgi:hypothetical protein